MPDQDIRGLHSEYQVLFADPDFLHKAGFLQRGIQAPVKTPALRSTSPSIARYGKEILSGETLPEIATLSRSTRPHLRARKNKLDSNSNLEILLPRPI